MENLKIKVNNKAESKEAQELFFELGAGWKDSGKTFLTYDSTFPFFYLDGVILHKGSSLSNYDTCNRKEITLPQLQDMVVLKRNDVGDATHIDSNNYDWYVASDEKHYRHQGDIWVYQPYVGCLDLKPISKEDSFSKPEELPFIDDEPHTKVAHGELFDKIRNGEVTVDFSTYNNAEVAFNPGVEHPQHYTSHPSGIECIDITRHHDFAIGNAIKYLWRAGLKDSDNEIQDLEKAVWYIQDKISQLKLVH